MNEDRMSARPPRPEVLAFLDAIKDTPEDDTPRLILADWLQENGDEHDRTRGEYLRLECWAAQLPEGETARTEMEREAGRLWREHSPAWLADFPEGLRCQRGTRGMLRLTTEIRHLAAPTSADLAGEAREWIDSLRLRTATVNGLTKVVASGLFDGLNHVDFRECQLRAAGVRELVKGRRLDRLRSLDLRGNWIEHQGIQSLVRGSALRHVEELDLSRNMLWPDSLASLAGAGALTALTCLNLADHSFGDRGVLHLLQAPWLGQVRSLNLNSTQLTDQGLTALARSPRVANLVKLSVAQNRLTTAGIAELAHSPYLERLTALDLGQTHPGSDVGAELGASPLLRRLKILDFTGCYSLNSAGVRSLVSADSWGRLESLSLSGCQVGDEGAQHLAGVIGPPLRDLFLGHARIGNDGARALAAADGLETLGTLVLRGNTIESAILARLRQRLGNRLIV